MLRQALTIARKDTVYFFTSPVIVVFAVVFMLLTGSITIYTGSFLERNQADLQSLFSYLPWIFVIIMPALAMRTFSEEYQLGTIENLFALPLPLSDLVIGKFLAVWLVAGLVTASSASFFITVHYLGDPDNGAAIAGFIGALLLAGAYLSIGVLASVLSSSQVIAFIVAAAASFVFTALGAPIINHFFADILSPQLFSFFISLSLLTHFTSISKGILDFKDVFFFFSFILTTLFIAVAALHQRKISRPRFSIHALLAIAAFLSLNFAVSLTHNWRIDLTEQKLFSLSENSKKLLQSIETPTTISFYYSQRLDEISPTYALFATRVRNLIQEIQASAGNKIQTQFISPIPFAPSEDNAIKVGLQGIPLDDTSKVYIGVHVQAGDNSDSIPILQPQREKFIEYDIIKMIAQVQQAEKPPIGIISSLPVFGMPDFSGQSQGTLAWIAFEQAQELFEMSNIFAPEDILNKDWRLLVLVHPSAEQMTDSMRYAIDQYLLKGGSLLMFADPLSEVQPTSFGTTTAPSSTAVANAILEQTGVTITDDILGDPALAVTVNVGNSSNPQSLPYVSWMSLSPENINNDLPSVAQIRDLLIPTAGIIAYKDEDAEKKGIKVEKMLFSSAQGAALSAEEFASPIPDLQNLYKMATDPTTDHQVYPLAVQISGLMKSNFPEGAPRIKEPTEDTETESTEEITEETNDTTDFQFPDHIAESREPFSITLVADTDFLRDRFWARTQNLLGQRIVIPQADNGSLLLNLLEVGSDNLLLLGLRGKGSSTRSFTRFEELQQQANLQFLDEEQELRKKLEQTEQKLQELNQDESGDNVETLSAEATQALIDTRQKLRNVQLKLRQSQERLTDLIIFFNIGFLPVLVIVGSLVVAFIRHRRRTALSKR